MPLLPRFRKTCCAMSSSDDDNKTTPRPKKSSSNPEPKTPTKASTEQACGRSPNSEATPKPKKPRSRLRPEAAPFQSSRSNSYAPTRDPSPIPPPSQSSWPLPPLAPHPPPMTWPIDPELPPHAKQAPQPVSIGDPRQIAWNKIARELYLTGAPEVLGDLMFPDRELPKEAFGPMASGELPLLMTGPFTEMGVPQHLDELMRGAYTVGGVQGMAVVPPEANRVEEGNIDQTEGKSLSSVAEVEEEEDTNVPVAERGKGKSRNSDKERDSQDSDSRGGRRGRGRGRGGRGRSRGKRSGDSDTASESTDSAGTKEQKRNTRRTGSRDRENHRGRGN